MPNNEKVWVRIPAGQSKLQKRFDNMFQAYRQGKIELMKKLDQDEAGEDAAEVGMKASIYDDPDQQQQAARKATLQVADRKKAANFAAQRKGLIKPQFDPGEDDDFYKRKVMAQPAAQGPAADALDQRVNAFKQQQPRQSVPADDLWQKLIQTHAAPSSATDTDADARWQQAMQANAGTINIEPLPTSQRPFAAQGAPMPLRKAECFQYRGTKLIGESRKHYAYFPVNENVEPSALPLNRPHHRRSLVSLLRPCHHWWGCPVSAHSHHWILWSGKLRLLALRRLWCRRCGWPLSRQLHLILGNIL
jgi:hypothetical protein